MQWNGGERIKSARKKAGLTLDELSNKLDISKRTLINYESNKQEPQISILLEVAKICSVNVLTLILNQDVPDHFLAVNILTDPKVEYAPKFENTELLKKLMESEIGREFFINYLKQHFNFADLSTEVLKLFIETHSTKQIEEGNNG